MAFGVPGLHEALAKLDETSEQMLALVNGIGEVVELLKEQNRLIEDANNIAQHSHT